MACAPPERAQIGSVGPAIPGLETRLGADDELLVRGPTVMRGYRNDAARTAEAFDADGWLLTGDVATIDADGYITLIDRKKELIVNASGKNMSPTKIEQHLKDASPLIAGACAIGDDRPYITALLVLEPAVRERHEEGDPALNAQIAAAVATANAQLARVEQVKRYEILWDDWSPGGDEMTPTMKLRRKRIAAKYAVPIDALYARA